MTRYSIIMSLVMTLGFYSQAATPATDNHVVTLEYFDQGSSDYVIVFESGFGSGAEVWEHVVAALGSQIRTIRYSRAGLGDSPPRQKALTIDQHVEELSNLLESLDILSKAILVGHSYGGLLVTELAEANPGLVAGLVLVDPSTRAQRAIFKGINPERVAADDEMLLQMMPPSLKEDYQILIDQLDAATPTVKPLPSGVPTVLFTSTAFIEKPLVFEETVLGKESWLKMHQTLFANVREGMHIRESNSGHNIHIEKPAEIAEAIVRLVGYLESAGGDAEKGAE